MSSPVILAHGALGEYDEVIFITIIVIFIVMMGISWVRSRGVDDTRTSASDPMPTANGATRDHVELE